MGGEFRLCDLPCFSNEFKSLPNSFPFRFITSHVNKITAKRNKIQLNYTNGITNQHKSSYVTRKDAELYDLKHTCLTNLGRAGASLKELMDLPGHTQVETVLKYQLSDFDRVASAVERMAEWRGAVCGGWGIVRSSQSNRFYGAEK